LLIHAQDLTVRIGSELILDQVDFSLQTGEIVTIVGPNGSGKSTMLRVLVGALEPSSGQITRAPGLRIGYVPQRLHIERTLPMSVRRFLDLPYRIDSAALAEVVKKVQVAHLLQRQMINLSGGQFQRVLLARALLNRPQVLVLDEATQGLDQTGSAEFYRQIEAVRNEIGCAVLMVSHELHVVMSASDRVVCLNRHVCCEGAPDVVSSRPEYRALFGTGTLGALALYRHEHDHSHDTDHVHERSHDTDHGHGHSHDTDGDSAGQGTGRSVN
jgi:zinc transport system ATP-binding protein